MLFSAREIRSNATSVLLWASFLSAFLFFGIGANLLLLWVSTGLLLGALLVQPLRRWDTLVTQRPTDLLLCGWVLAVLLGSQLFVTTEPEVSFAVSWILAGAPLGYLACAAMTDRRLLHHLVVATVVIFAGISVVRFFADGVRAYEPLEDPNNYACLLYLVWIPLAHRFALRAWEEQRGLLPVAQAALLLLLLIALFATKSRAGTVIVGAALVGWWLLAIRYRLSLLPPLALSGLAIAGYALVALLAPDTATKLVDQSSLSAGVAVRSAMNLSAWQMFLDAPLAGHGVFSFARLYALYRLPEDQSTAGIYAHNDYLQLMAETGLLLLPVLLVVALATARRLWLILHRPDADRLKQFGFAMALAAALSHAAINFVFYILPLTLLLAGICAELYGSSTSKPEASGAAPGARRGGGLPAKGLALAASLLGVCAWLYLGVDVATQVVFAGQPGPSAVQRLRSSPEQMRDYAVFAQRVNGRRVTPVLGEALVNVALLERDGGASEQQRQIRDQFRLALQMDPLNPFSHEQYYRFLRRVEDPEFLATLREEENPVVLLRRAYELDVRQAATALELVSVYDRLNASELGDEFLAEEVLPWLRLIHQTDPAGAARVVDEATRRARSAGDDGRVRELEARREAVSGALEPPQPNWLRDLMLGA